MKIHVEQMRRWNSYAYYAEEVEEKYWAFFCEDLWWQVGNSFIRVYDGVPDFEYCAKNFSKYGDTIIRQQLKIIPSPWEKALEWLIPQMKKLGVDWYIHGSAAMALWGIPVSPRDLNVIVPDEAQFDKVRAHFTPWSFKPFERCENWVMSGLGYVFSEAVIGFSFHNRGQLPLDTKRLEKRRFLGQDVYVSSLESLKKDNLYFGRPERVRMIEDRMNGPVREL